jgi:hypothetical protein
MRRMGAARACYILLVDSAATKALPPQGDVFIPHDVQPHPMTAVRNSVLQGSLTLLRQGDLYERYAKLVDPAVLLQISTNVTPYWVPIEVVDEHYRACDAMALSAEELESLGRAAGEISRKTAIVVAQPDKNASFDLWPNMARLHRVWKRLYQGGSVQIVKLGDTDLLMDFRGFSLHRHRYYRYGCLAAIRSVHESVGQKIKLVQIVRHDPRTHEVTVHLAWT